MTPFAFFIRAAGLGLAAAGTPGPLQALLISESLSGGWRRGALVTLAPLFTDLPIILLFIFVFQQVPNWFLRGLSLVGGLFVLYLAWGVWQDWRRMGREGGGNAGISAPQSITLGLRRAVMINFLSPGLYLYWALVNGPLLVEAWQQSPAHAVTFLLGFYSFFIGTMLLLVGLFSGARRLGEQVTHWLQLLSGGLLLLFGLLLLWDGLLG